MKLLLILAAAMTHATLWADASMLQLRKQAGDLVITLFTSPRPLMAGPVEISLLLQGAQGLEPVLDANALVSLRHIDSDIEFRAYPTRQQARNKLLYVAPVVFPRAGKWEVAITVRRNGQENSVRGIIYVAPAPNKAISYAGYIAFPPTMIVLFVVRERLIRRKSKG